MMYYHEMEGKKKKQRTRHAPTYQRWNRKEKKRYIKFSCYIKHPITKKSKYPEQNEVIYVPKQRNRSG